MGSFASGGVHFLPSVGTALHRANSSGFCAYNLTKSRVELVKVVCLSQCGRITFTGAILAHPTRGNRTKKCLLWKRLGSIERLGEIRDSWATLRVLPGGC
jgi:hypothetical protein